MKSILGAIIFVAVSYYPYMARADVILDTGSASLASIQSDVSAQPAAGVPNSSVPDISKWNVINVSRIELAVSDGVVAYVGLEIEYNNPADQKEFIRVIRRHIPLIIAKQKKQDEHLFSDMVVTFYTRKEQEDTLGSASGKSDPIVYVHWRIKKNIRNGKDEQDGTADVWMRSFDGNWSRFKNMSVDIEFLSENVGNGKPHNVFTGMKYKVGDVYNIIRINRDDLVRLFKAGE